MEKVEKHIAPTQEEPIRLSDYVPGIFMSITSKKGMKKAIEKGLVKVNDEIAFTSKYIKGGEVIELYKAAVDNNLPSIKLDLEVLYEDEHLALINKPAGIVVSGNKEKTVSNALPSALKKSSELDALDRPQPAHRLDYPTSGLLLVGKTASTLTLLNQLFEKKSIEKTYIAITIKKMKSEGNISDVIKGKKAETAYKVVQEIQSPKFEFLNYVELKPKTGRRHQLRIHMAGIGNPILGDHTYGLEKKVSQGRGLYLHAIEMKFDHPKTGEEINITTSLPEKFEKILANPIGKGVSD